MSKHVELTSQQRRKQAVLVLDAMDQHCNNGYMRHTFRNKQLTQYVGLSSHQIAHTMRRLLKLRAVTIFNTGGNGLRRYRINFTSEQLPQLIQRIYNTIK
jgi:hypothetical protein